MPIDFTCTGCHKTLRVGDDTAGKQAKCPHCGAVLTIPAAEAVQYAPAPSSGDAFNPYQAPQTSSVESPMSVVGGAFQPSRLVGSEVRTLAWEILKQNMGLCVGGGLAMLVLSLVIGGVSSAIAEGVAALVSADPIVNLLVQFPFVFFSWVLSTWITGGAIAFWLALVRNAQPNIQLIFSGQHYFSRLIGPSIVFYLGIYLFQIATVAIGFTSGIADAPLLFLLFIPLSLVMIYAVFIYGQFTYLLVDGHATGMDAFGLSRRIMQGNLLAYLGLMIICGLVMIGGAMLCGVGILFAYPYFMLNVILAYLMMTGQLARRAA